MPYVDPKSIRPPSPQKSGNRNLANPEELARKLQPIYLEQVVKETVERVIKDEFTKRGYKVSSPKR